MLNAKGTILRKINAPFIIHFLQFQSKYSMCVCVYIYIYIYIYIYMEVNNGKESDSIEKIEKQSNPKVMNLLQRKVNNI